MEDPLTPDPLPDSSREDDAGAAFVLESKGQWWHAGFHLTTAIVGPTILTLPYAFRGLGWVPGFLCLTVMGVVTFYSYQLMSLVLERCEKKGRRHIRFRELAADVLGSGWMFYFVIFIQTAINTGVGIGAILLAGECLQIMYSNLWPNGTMKLYEFIAIATVVMIVLSQLPTFHSLRHINLVSLLLSLGYTFLVVGACVHAGKITSAYFLLRTALDLIQNHTHAQNNNQQNAQRKNKAKTHVVLLLWAHPRFTLVFHHVSNTEDSIKFIGCCVQQNIYPRALH